MKAKRRPKGFDSMVAVIRDKHLDDRTILAFTLRTNVTDPRSLDILIQAARKALAASVLDSETALSHLPQP